MKNRKNWLGLLTPLVLYALIHSLLQVLTEVLLGAAVCAAHSMALQAAGNLVFLCLLLPVYRRQLEKSRPQGWERKLSVPVCLLLLSASCFCSRGLNLLLELSPLPRWFPSYEQASAAVYAEPLGIQILAVVLLAPLAEELLMRGILYERLRELTGGVRPAILGSTLFFAVFHGNMVQGVYAFFLGLLFAWLTEECRNLWAPVLAHGAANALSLFLSYVNLPLLPGNALIRKLFLTAGCLLAGFLFCKVLSNCLKTEGK